MAAALALPFLFASPVGATDQQASTSKRENVRVTRKIEVDGKTVSISVRDRDTSDRDSDSSTITLRSDFAAGAIRVSGDDGSGIVRLFSDCEVGEGERVSGDVVAVFGSVRVDGEVTGNVVSVLGSTALGPKAHVHGDAVSVGGGLTEAPGAVVNGQTVQIGFLPFTFGLPGLPVMLSMLAIGWLISLFFGWMAATLFPGHVARVAITSSRRTAASMALGILSGPIMLISMLLLMVTVIGIPVAIFLPVVYIAIVYMGHIAATYVLGCKLTRRRLGEGKVTGPLIAGSILVASIFALSAILWETPGVVRTAALFFLLVGVLLVVGLACIGTGAFLLSRAGTRPRDLDAPSHGEAPAAPAGAPSYPVA